MLDIALILMNFFDMKNILSIGIFAVTSLFCASLAASNSNLNFASSYDVLEEKKVKMKK